jgi:tryptophan-rich sensory protein
MASFGAGSLGAFFMPGAWYAGLNKPSWNPPNWVFAPVWSALYTLMGVAAWLVWRRGGFSVRRLPLMLFLAQLALNAAWTPLFFGLHHLGLAFAEILLLWGVLAATAVVFFRVDRPAGTMLLPYLAWVSFAAMLNLALWRLNS